MHPDSLFSPKQSDVVTVMTWPVSYKAKRYVTFAMERNVQQSWCAQLGVCPTHEGIARPERFVGDPAYPDAPDDYSNALFLPNGILEKYEHGLWRDKFNQIF